MAYKIFLNKKTITIRLFLYIFEFLLINQINFINCENIIDITDIYFLNNVITLNHNSWRAGHGVSNKNGDFIMEFSTNHAESSSRLFFGLKKDGTYFYPEVPFFKEIHSMTCSNCAGTFTNNGRFYSLNIFLSLIDDETKSKQYLFSMSSDYLLTELIDIENDFSYYAWSSGTFFDYTAPWGYQYSLFEIGNTNTYITVFPETGGSIVIEKFHFEQFDVNSNR